MTDSNAQLKENPWDDENPIIAAGLRATEIAVKNSVDENFISRAKSQIQYPTSTLVTLATNGIDSERYAGFGIAMSRSYGPKSRTDNPVPVEKALESNHLRVLGKLIFKNQETEILTAKNKKDISRALKEIALTRECGFSFDVGEIIQEKDDDSSFITYDNLKLSNIHDLNGNNMGIEITIDFGLSDESSDILQTQKLEDSKEQAERDIEEGKLVTKMHFQSPKGITMETTDIKDDQGIPVDNSQIIDKSAEKKAKTAVLIYQRLIELVAEETSEEQNIEIDLPFLTAQELIDRDNDPNHPDWDWMKM